MYSLLPIRPVRDLIEVIGTWIYSELETSE